MRSATSTLTNFICLALLNIGCASVGLNTREVNEAELSKVRSAALAGFDIRTPTAIGDTREALPYSKKIYKDFLETLIEKSSWKIHDESRIKSNPLYQQLYAETMKGFQFKSTPGENSQAFYLPEIIDSESFRVMGTNKRDALMEALKTDALVTVRTQGIIEATTFMGIGTRKLYARLWVIVWAKGQESPIFFDSNIKGPLRDKSLGAVGIYKIPDVLELLQESAKVAAKQGLKLNSVSKARN